MNKNGKRFFVILGLLFVIFSIVSFGIPAEKNITAWLAYLFGIMSIAFQIYVFGITFLEDNVKSRLYGFPVIKISIAYMLVQLIISLVEIILAGTLPFWIVLIVNVVLLGATVIGCILNNSVKEELIRQDKELVNKTEKMRELQSIATTMYSSCGSEDIKKILYKLSEDFKYSDPVSSAETEELEMQMRNEMNRLKSAIAENNTGSVKALCDGLGSMLAERNRLCALHKH